MFWIVKEQDGYFLNNQSFQNNSTASVEKLRQVEKLCFVHKHCTLWYDIPLQSAGHEYYKNISFVYKGDQYKYPH